VDRLHDLVRIVRQKRENLVLAFDRIGLRPARAFPRSPDTRKKENRARKYGTMVKSPSGYPIQSPYVSIANRHAELMMRISAESGFTPASRSRIAIPRPDEPSLFD
jgi:hypothetical protein